MKAAVSGYISGQAASTGPEETSPPPRWFNLLRHPKKRIINGLVDSNNTLSTALSEQSKTNATLNADLLESIHNETVTKARIHVLEEQLAASRDGEQRLTDQLREAQRHHESVDSNSVALDRHILTLEADIQRLECDKTWMGKEMQSNVEMIDRLNDHIQQITRGNEAEKADNKALKEEKSNLEKNLIDVHAKVRDLETVHGKIKDKLKKEKKIRRRLEARLQKYDTMLVEIEVEKGRTEAETRTALVLLKGELDKLEKTVKKKSDRIRRLQSDKLQLVEYYSTRCGSCACATCSPSVKNMEDKLAALCLGTSLSDRLHIKVRENIALPK